MGIFDGINFGALPVEFKEDSVREEVITPLLKCLGYSSFDTENRIIRSPRLEHPFVHFGTRRMKIDLIPDYLIQVNKVNAFIVEAKSPLESILTGKNVEQAYSYAIHSKVQVRRFVLCNGREISIFDVDKIEPLLYFKLEIANEKNWGDLFELLSPVAFTNPHIFNYKLDYGIWCIENGIEQDLLQCFYNCYITNVVKLDENTFTFMSALQRGVELLASFDFDISLLQGFMQQIPGFLKETVQNSLSMYPFKYSAEDSGESFSLNFEAVLSEYVIPNSMEHYLPLKVKRFL
ncbi:hypothetical protein U6B65_08440 [Oscillospiraceae bacterium MB08-C2-2]|nr:hypothetical protein U6B65_08440 [Oscillospiraceae bacterium MB08-C2-2]